MSRTTRKLRKSQSVTRDGARQYASVLCEHHGWCPKCRGDRTFQRAPSLRESMMERDGILSDIADENTP